MGVRGLTTYINNNQDCFLKQHYLHDTSLIIDGLSLAAQLYAKSNCLSAFGGDYDKYASHVKEFFQRLKKCNVNSYVLFDGSYERKKLRTAYHRLRSKIYGASRLDPVTQRVLKIFPLFLRDVFKNVLSDINIPFTICEFEADNEIAAMGRHLQCPILSYDSDFFIYNVQYIPFITIDSQVCFIENADKKINALECKIFKVEYLCQHFGNLKKELLPLMATLLGNDFVEKKLFKNFFDQLKLGKTKKKTNDQQRSILALLKWLSEETLDSAIEKIIGRLKKSEKIKVFNIINKSVEGYHTEYCKSLEYFGFSSDNTLQYPSCLFHMDDEITDDSEESTKDEQDSENSDSQDSEESNTSSEVSNCAEACSEITELPDIIVEGIRKGYISQPYLKLYTLNLYFCSPQAEDYSQDDAFFCALPILRYGFDILTNFSKENFIYVSREKDKYRRITIVKEDLYIANPFEQCKIPLENDDMLPKYFEHFIKIKFPDLDQTLITKLPETYRLFMISILWWISSCNVSKANVYSLFLCYIMLEVIDEKTGKFRGHNYFHNKYSKKLQELKKRNIDKTEFEDLFLNKNKVLYEDCLLAASQLITFFEIDNEIRKHPKRYYSKRLHTFAQFQCCLLEFSSLNSICRFPYEVCKIFNCFNGTFVYNLSSKLEQQTDLLLFIEHHLLKGANTVWYFFKSLCTVYDQCVQQMRINTVEVDKKKRGRRNKKSKDTFTIFSLESEVIIH